MPRLNLSNSIYQQKGLGYGLTVKDGMLINNRPCGQTGIKQISDMKKEIRRQEKIEIVAQGINRAEDMKKFVF